MDVELKIEGMSCGHCVAAVREALEAIPGVSSVAVEVGRARLRLDPARASEAQLDEAVREAGYQVAH